MLRELERLAARPPMAEVFARSASRRIDLPLDEAVGWIRAADREGQ